MVLNFDKKWVDIVYKQLTNNEFPWYFQKFVLNGARFRQYKWEWLKRLDQYYKL